jgi:assimilatory nitrate reductase electron transfer subunit
VRRTAGTGVIAGKPKPRLVITGNGMATARLLEELATVGAIGCYDVTVIGDEPHPPYNRVLLSSVLQGTHTTDAISMRTPSWYAARGVRVLTGIRVTGIDRARRTVHLGDGRRLPYDRLVLATGAGPVLPPIRGVITRRNRGSRLHPRVFAFRTLSDCLQLLAATRTARTAVVAGGGLLGLEAARGLAQRGLTVDVLEVAEHLMPHQLDAAPARVLRRSVERLGIGVHTAVKAVGVTGNAGHAGHAGHAGDATSLTGVRLDDGYLLSADVVVLACGVRPNVSLARTSGLRVNHGIVVDDQLRSVSDPDVYALGDCAEHRGQVPGLVAAAWDQAAVLARVLLSDPTARYEGSRPVRRLRASDLDVAVIGSLDVRPDDEVVEFANPLRGVYRRLIVRKGRLHGAVLLGELDGVGLLIQYYDRGAILPADPAWQLLGDPACAAGAGWHSGQPLPDDAEICRCNSVTAGVIRACGAAGTVSLDEVAARTRATTGCGSCTGAVEALLRAAHVTPAAV